MNSKMKLVRNYLINYFHFYVKQITNLDSKIFNYFDIVVLMDMIIKRLKEFKIYFTLKVFETVHSEVN